MLTTKLAGSERRVERREGNPNVKTQKMERTLNRAEADSLNAASANEEQMGARRIHRAVGSTTGCGGDGWGN